MKRNNVLPASNLSATAFRVVSIGIVLAAAGCMSPTGGDEVDMPFTITFTGGYVPELNQDRFVPGTSPGAPPNNTYLVLHDKRTNEEARPSSSVCPSTAQCSGNVTQDSFDYEPGQPQQLFPMGTNGRVTINFSQPVAAYWLLGGPTPPESVDSESELGVCDRIVGKTMLGPSSDYEDGLLLDLRTSGTVFFEFGYDCDNWRSSN